jgi:hypothetical protein
MHRVKREGRACMHRTEFVLKLGKHVWLQSARRCRALAVSLVFPKSHSA